MNFNDKKLSLSLNNPTVKLLFIHIQIQSYSHFRESDNLFVVSISGISLKFKKRSSLRM